MRDEAGVGKQAKPSEETSLPAGHRKDCSSIGGEHGVAAEGWYDLPAQLSCVSQATIRVGLWCACNAKQQTLLKGNIVAAERELQRRECIYVYTEPRELVWR